MFEAFQTFRIAFDAAAPLLAMVAWFAVLFVTGFLGIIFGGAVVVEKDIEVLPHCIGCIIAALIAVYRIGGM